MIVQYARVHRDVMVTNSLVLTGYWLDIKTQPQSHTINRS